jgi:hypothetical protein
MFFLGWQGVYTFIGLVVFIILLIVGFAKLANK